MTNKLIRRFSINGVMHTTNILKSKETYRKTIITMMKDEGFAPLIDLNPVFEWSWVKDDYFNFSYTWQGVYVGKDKAWQTEGVSDGKTIPSIPKIK